MTNPDKPDMYQFLKRMKPENAAEYVYATYAKSKDDPGVQRWIDENAKVYAETVKRLRFDKTE